MDAKLFSAVLHEWAEVFMQRSMSDFKRFMDDSGLSPSQVNTLMRLYHQPQCGVSEVAVSLGITNAAASQMVERLVQMDLLERTEDPFDRRVKQLSLTPNGRSLVKRGIDARRCWMEELTSNLTPEQQGHIAEALSMLTQAARELDIRSASAQPSHESH